MPHERVGRNCRSGCTTVILSFVEPSVEKRGHRPHRNWRSNSKIFSHDELRFSSEGSIFRGVVRIVNDRHVVIPLSAFVHVRIRDLFQLRVPSQQRHSNLASHFVVHFKHVSAVKVGIEDAATRFNQAENEDQYDTKGQPGIE